MLFMNVFYMRKIKESFGKSGLSQPLLMSEIIDVSPDLMAIFNEHRSLFKSFHFQIEEFGDQN